MNDAIKTILYGICALVGIAALLAALTVLSNGCAAIKYGTDSDYVRQLDAPYMVGTQINGVKLMSDKGTVPAMMDVLPSAAADVALLPYHLFLYWQHDKTEIPKFGPGTE